MNDIMRRSRADGDTARVRISASPAALRARMNPSDDEMAKVPGVASNSDRARLSHASGKQAAWIARVAVHDPADLGGLLATLVDVKQEPVIAERVAMLATWPADPRIAMAFANLYLSPAVANWTWALARPGLILGLVRSADPRAIDFRLVQRRRPDSL